MTRKIKFRYKFDTTKIKFNISEILNRLNERTIFDDKTGCWLYTGSKSFSGYGHLAIENKFYYVHRLSAYIFLKLDLHDRTQHALHKENCPNKHCWNWNHLYVGDNCDNMRDLKIRGRKLNATKLNKESNQQPQQSTITTKKD